MGLVIVTLSHPSLEWFVAAYALYVLGWLLLERTCPDDLVGPIVGIEEYCDFCEWYPLRPSVSFTVKGTDALLAYNMFTLVAL